MKPGQGKGLPYRRLLRKYWAWLGVGGFLWLFFFQPYTLPEVWRMHREKRRLEAEIRRYEARIDSMHEALQRLDDPAYIEYIARMQYGMKRPEEVVFKVVETP